MLAPFENQRGWKTFESHGLLYCIWNWGEESTLTVSFLVCVQLVSLPFDSNATQTYFVPGSNMQKISTSHLNTTMQSTYFFYYLPLGMGHAGNINFVWFG